MDKPFFQMDTDKISRDLSKIHRDMKFLAKTLQQYDDEGTVTQEAEEIAEQLLAYKQFLRSELWKAGQLDSE